LLLEGRDWDLAGRLQGIGGQTLSVRGLHDTYRDLRIHLFGEHTARNAAAAVVGAEALLDRPLKEEILADAFDRFTAPGRMEVTSRRPLVVLDGAHNPAGARALTAALPEAFAWDEVRLVLAVSANKDIEGIAGELVPLRPTTVLAARNDSARSAPAERVAEACRTVGLADPEIVPSVQAGLESARSVADPRDLILVTGSLYTVADARRAIIT
jgi:dihydrofolate synthase/folylpolyglutamate synthase